MTTQRLPLEYRLRTPTIDVGPPPLLILLHGYGSNEADLFDLANEMPPELLVLSVRAPYTLSRNQYAWFGLDFSSGKAIHDSVQAEKSRLLLKHFIDEAVREFMVDPKQIFLVGFSQGAIMSASIALTFPSLVSSIAMLSGRILEEIKNLVERGEAPAPLRVFLAHGTEDKVLPIFHAREAKKYLDTLQVELTYHEYPMQHSISMDERTALVQWVRNGLSKFRMIR